jgi:hypothetical protein
MADIPVSHDLIMRKLQEQALQLVERDLVIETLLGRIAE